MGSLGIDEGTQRKEAKKVLQGVDGNYSGDYFKSCSRDCLYL